MLKFSSTQDYNNGTMSKCAKKKRSGIQMLDYPADLKMTGTVALKQSRTFPLTS